MNSMNSSPPPHRWIVLALQATLLAAAFAVGRWCATRPETQTPAAMPKIVSLATNPPSKNAASTPAPSAPAKLAQAKTSLDKILLMEGRFEREKALLDFAAGLDPQTIKNILDDLETKTLSGNNKQAIGILLNQWAETDPQAALDSLKSLHPENYIPLAKLFAAGIFEAWSAKDPAAAFAGISQLPAGEVMGLNLRQDALHAVIANMVALDPQSALSTLLNQPLSGDSTQIYEDLFTDLAALDPVNAATTALNLPPSALRNEALNDVARTWAAQDFAKALAWANALPAGDAKDSAINSVLTIMSQQDAPAAAAYALQLPAGSNRNDLLQNIADEWAQADPAGLLAWAGKNLTGDAYTETAVQALNAMGQMDPVAAARAIAQISDSNLLTPAIKTLARNWAQQDIQGALNWAQSLPTDNAGARNAAISDILAVWTSNDPQSTAAYIKQNAASDPYFATASTSTIDSWVDSWANSDPQGAVAWAQSLPAGNLYDVAVASALGDLAKVDPQSAMNVAEQLPPSARDKADINIVYG